MKTITKIFVFMSCSILCIILNSTNVLAEGKREPRWSAEDVHDESVNTHLWIVNQALSILTKNAKDVSLLQEFKSALQQGIYDADYKCS